MSNADDMSLLIVELRQRLQRLVERDEILTRLLGHDERGRTRHCLAVDQADVHFR